MGRSDSASTRSLSAADSNKEGGNIVDKGEKRIKSLKKELAELKVAFDEAEHRFKTENGVRKSEQLKNESLQRDLQESRNLVAQLEKRCKEDA